MAPETSRPARATRYLQTTRGLLRAGQFPELTGPTDRLLYPQQTRHASAPTSKRNSGGFFLPPKERVTTPNRHRSPPEGNQPLSAEAACRREPNTSVDPACRGGGAHAGRWLFLGRPTRGCARGLACPGLTNGVLSGLHGRSRADGTGRPFGTAGVGPDGTTFTSPGRSPGYRRGNHLHPAWVPPTRGNGPRPEPAR